jgi:hypothetical protein
LWRKNVPEVVGRYFGHRRRSDLRHCLRINLRATHHPDDALQLHPRFILYEHTSVVIATKLNCSEWSSVLWSSKYARRRSIGPTTNAISGRGATELRNLGTTPWA